MFGDKKQLKKSQEDNRTFSYEKDGVNLKFTLRIDVKRELVAFAELLKEAQSDVYGAIEKVGERED